MSSKSAPKEEAGGAEEKKSSLMKYIILGVAVIALAGGGFFGYKKFFHAAEPEAEAKVHVEQKVVHDWESFLVNLADPGGKRYIKVAIKMELTSPHVAEEITNRGHEFKDAMIMLLSGKEFEDIATPAGKMTLKQEIMTQLNRGLKNGQVTEVYFTDFIVQ